MSTTRAADFVSGSSPALQIISTSASIFSLLEWCSLVSGVREKSTVSKMFSQISLPESYAALFTKKCDTVFELMLNYASQGLKWAA
jgi:hypothetical protein